MGIARLLLVGVAILVVLVLIVVGALSLIGSLKSDEPGPSPAGSAQVPQGGPASSAPPVSVSAVRTAADTDIPTLFVECRADRCPLFVRASGGDVVEDRELGKGQQASYSEAGLEVVLDDASTVYVEVNGRPRPPGEPGERQSFTAKRATPG